MIIGVDPDPASAPALRDWAVGYWEALHPYSAGGAYVNFMMDEGQERVKATYGDNYERLAKIKAEVRPGQRVPRQPEHPAGRIGARPEPLPNRSQRLAERLLLGQHALEQIAVLLDPRENGRPSRRRGGSSPSRTSSQRSGVDTGAPGCGRTE